MSRSSTKKPSETAQCLKDARNKLGWTQVGLARKICENTKTSLSIPTIKQYEEGIRAPSQNTVQIVSYVLEKYIGSDFRRAIEIALLRDGRRLLLYFPPSEILTEEPRKIHISRESHLVEYSPDSILVRWNGAPSLECLKETRVFMEKELDKRPYRSFIADMTYSKPPDTSARRWSVDWLKANRIEVMAFLGASLDTRLVLMHMIEVVSFEGGNSPNIIFAHSEIAAKKCLQVYAEMQFHRAHGV